MRRAIGIVRVSRVAGREGESFISPDEQRERIQAACERDGLQLVATIEELDTSGGAPLEKRELRHAIEAVEEGRADVIVAAYFDRLVRSLKVQQEIVERVEAAGGRVLALDFGEVSGQSAANWLSSTLIGAVAEYQRRMIRERSGEAQARAVARGVAPWPDVPFGYRRGEDGRFYPHPETADLVRRAFEMRADGATIYQVRQMLRDAGHTLDYSVVRRILLNRVYLGEVKHGRHFNPEAHEPIIDRGTFERATKRVVPRGPKPKSDRLLARLGILRCAGCGKPMGVSTAGNGTYRVYRCPDTSNKDCPLRANVKCEIAEEVVVTAVRKVLAKARGRAAADRDARRAEQEAADAQDALDRAIRAFGAAGVLDEPAAAEELAELRRKRDEAIARAEHLREVSSTLTISPHADWDQLTRDEKRALIRAVVKRAVVRRGRGPERITLELFDE